MDSREFSSSYMSVVLYLSETDPVLAEYLLARFPHFLETNQSVFVKVKRNTNKWLQKVRFQQQDTKEKLKNLPYDVFLNSVYDLARVYTYGSRNIPRNTYRANKFIRILKLMGDYRYERLQKQNSEIKIRK